MRPRRPYMNGQMRPNHYYDNSNRPARFPPPMMSVQPWSNFQLPNIQLIPAGFGGPNPMMNNNRFLLQQPVRHVQHRPYDGPQRGKRRIIPGDDDHDDNKRKKSNEESSSSSSSSSSTEEQYVVPCSKGTEKITVAIWEYFLQNKMNDDDLNKKLMLQNTLHSIIKEAFPDSRLFIVGSSMTGFATRTSDVDMCLLISDNDIHQKKDAPTILTTLSKALRSCSFVYRPMVIRAKVPILKFTDNISGFECDLNINNTIGIRNTHLLRYYAHMDWRVRPLMLFIKRWARFHDINDASKKTISSYSLSLMLLHYLQAGVKPAVLPCLQTMKPKLFSYKQDVRKLSLDLEKIDFTSANRSTLGELFLGFLDYYSNVFAYEMDIVSVRRGRTITHDDVSYLESDWKFLCIEEPFEGTNTARSVYDHFVFQRILRVFVTSFQVLQRTRNVDSILRCPF